MSTNLNRLRSLFVRARGLQKPMIKFSKNMAIGTVVGAVGGSIMSSIQKEKDGSNNEPKNRFDTLLSSIDAFDGAVIGGWIGATVTLPKKILPLTGLFLAYNYYKITTEREMRQTCWTEIGPNGKKMTVCYEGTDESNCKWTEKPARN